ncbi:MAG: hypothetical protein HONBIEJF_02819 [Fimbriimonadaceae bacterium]|nr:hypothetical protein [Fimbriimonadaceae bacterium]
MARSRAKKVVLFVVGIFVGVLAYLAYRFGPALLDLANAGWTLSDIEQREYQGTSKQNLEAIHVALMLYHDSEGAFPPAATWMDVTKLRLKTRDLSDEESLKKLKNPVLKNESEWGYAINEAVAGKYKDDIKDPEKTLLVFDSAATAWNAHGDPTKLSPKPARPGGNLGVTVSGKVIPLK